MTSAHRNKIQWAKRVPRHQVRRLYESDARGMLNEELLEEVGHGMYARCADMFEVHEAREGRIKCRHCGTMILRQSRFWDKSEVLACEKCGWQVTWGTYYDSYTGERLLPGAAEEVFRRSHAWADILSIARELGIEGRSRMREDELVAEMMRIAPEHFVAPHGEEESTPCST